ncbi:hypothetical protein ER308_08555 [Egibacter rhizosphaerae]|uniref:YihY/virulence factor BrkB family protein n=1 Tax=Egibacter rhizosphaerae TaxID=1670831 RepID=A0A411YET1_9ACTN|nr:YhjD/YihY/BrkB family envelope integrity protein [Egibacter rhizosphaerae]QBI19597.1 hypothetical protein ER308_08555 [Egibacter rhizosphaerae]
MSDVRRHAARAREQTPSLWVETLRGAGARNVLLLGAGLAFFGLISVGPSIAIGFGLLQFLASSEAVDAVIELLEDTPIDRFGLVDVLHEVEDQAGQIAGFSAVFLLWPATTLASGWARALNDAFGFEGPGPTGLKGRLRGLIPGAVLLVAAFLLLIAVSFGTALVGEGVLIALVIVPGAIVVQLAVNLVIYRWLPSEQLPWRALWRGAVLATGGVVLGTLAFTAALVFVQGFGDQYPEQLATAIVLGLWLYLLNLALLTGAEYNAARRRLERERDAPMRRT